MLTQTDQRAMPNRPHTARKEPAERQVWIDFARGIGVVLVVFGHVLGGLIPPGLFADGPLARWMSYTLYTFHMPLFFFLAGLNVEHSLQRGIRPFLASKGWTIAYPYVLWSLIQGGIIIALSRNANIPLTTDDLAAIWYRPMGQFWFLYALMICHLLAALVRSRAAMLAVAAVGLIVFLLLPVRPDLALTLHHLPFYVVGIVAARTLISWHPSPRSGWLLFAAIAMAFAAAIAIGGPLSGFDANGAASLPACILGIAGMVVFCKLLDDRSFGWLAVVGVMSMTIYVLHILAGAGTRMALQKMHVPAWPWLYLLGCTAAGVAGPMIAHVMLQRFNLLWPLGLAARPKSRRLAPA